MKKDTFQKAALALTAFAFAVLCACLGLFIAVVSF
jgi:hypothetical protein